MAQVIKHNSRSNSSSSSSAHSSISKPGKTTQKPTEITADKKVTPSSNFIRSQRASTRLSRTNNSPSVSSPAASQISTSQATGNLDSAACTHSHVKYQPSKVFVAKSKTELESLLGSIKGTFNEEVGSLNGDQSNVDLSICIGDNFEKSLHKCIFRSRAYKLYSALKSFFTEPESDPLVKDIVVSEFQNKEELGQLQEEKLDAEPIELNASGAELINQDNSQPKPNSTLCQLPDGLISPALFSSFARRIYLDQDLVTEEIHLQQIIVAWLKSNKPELVRVTTPVPKHLPDHRESFRTIQPDFDELPVGRSLVATMSQEAPTGTLVDLEERKSSNAADDQDDINSQTTSIRDESLTGSLLTRTETFELISKNIPNSPSIGNLNKSSPPNRSDDGKQGDDFLDDEPENTEPPLSPSAFAPTTRTGLKPKTFTVPSNVKAAAVAAAKASARSQQSKIATKSSTSGRSVTNEAVPAATKSNRVTTKRTSLSDASSRLDGSPDLSSSHSATSASPSAASTGSKVGKTTAKAKPLLMTRAQPISLERSQSPGTAGAIKNASGRNFIAANKKLISSIEKKTTHQSIAQEETSKDQSAINSSDTNEQDKIDWAVIESLSTDDLSAHLDKFALVSYSKLADALSKMLIDGIMSDAVVVTKEGRSIDAHKCILAARSAYFAESIKKLSLPSTYTESSGSVHIRIDLSEFSYPAVYFALIHIYTGAVKVPDDLELEELAKITHLLHVTTLKQVCAHNLKMNYCHFFHKPCAVCSQGVLKALPIAWRYDYTDLYSKCLQWIGNHFASIFCLKEFSELKPNDLIEECYSATLNLLTPENIIPKTIECQKLLKNLPRVKWTESIICLVGRQLEDFCHYVADNYEKILQSESFMNLSKNCWECEVLEENLLAAMNHLKPDSGCRTLIQLNKIECSTESYCEDPKNASDSFVNLISKMRKYCERYLLKEATAVVHCSSWRQMNPSLQKRIKDQAILSSDFDEPTKQLATKPKLLSMSRVTDQNSSSTSSADRATTRSPVSRRSTPDSKLKQSPGSTYLPQPKSKAAAARHVKVLK